MLQRILEPEVMDCEVEAMEYSMIDHAPKADEFIKTLKERTKFDGGLVVDLGAGPCDFPIGLAKEYPGAKVIAVEMSEAMLRIAQRRIDEEGLSDRILLLAVDVKATGLVDGVADLIICNSVVHHMGDPLAFFCEVNRLLKRGGHLLIKDLLRPNSVDELDRLVKTYVAHETASQQKMFRDSLHASLTIDELRRLCARAGLIDVTIEQVADRYWQLYK